MKNATIVLLLLLANFRLLGQAPGFSKTYGFEPDMTGSSFVNILVDNDTLVMFGIAVPTTAPVLQGLLFVKMDTNGNVILQKIHQDTEMAEFAVSSNFDIIKTTDGGYAIAGANYDTNKGILIKLTHDGEVEFYKKYDPDPHFLFHTRKVLELDNGFFLLGFKQSQDYDINVLLIKTDKEGDFVWEKTYGQPGLVDLGGSLVKISDNHFAIGASEGTDLSAGPPYPSNAYGRSVMVEIDSLGNVLSATKSLKNEQIGIIGLQKLPDGWLYCSAKLGLINSVTFSKRLTIVRTGEDINDVVWEKVISVSTDSYNQCWDIKPTPDGNWVAVSQLVVFGPPPPASGPAYFGGGIYKISPDGDRIWSRIDTVLWHPDCGAENYLGGVGTLSTSSVVAAGYANSNCYQNVRSYAWVLKVTNDGCLDTLYCGLVNGTMPGPPMAQGQVRVYPNPASEAVTIEAMVGYGKQFEASIHDATGMIRGVYLDGGSGVLTLQVGGFPAGIYFLAIRFPDGSVRYEKINIVR